MQPDTEEVKRTWGGKRRGAGRPAKENATKHQVSFKVDTLTLETIEARRRDDESIGQAARRLMLRALHTER